MSLTQFEFDWDCANFSAQSDNLIKNALILVEGIHKSNDGKIHEFPPIRVREIAKNVNKCATPIPLKIEHGQKQLKGKEKSYLPTEELGEIDRVQCRRITASDIKDPKHKNLIGKLGIFSKAKIISGIEDIAAKTISHLSPGVDLIKNTISEVSLVARPAIEGMALFSGATSYGAIKEKVQEHQELKKELLECFEIFFETVCNINSIDDREQIGLDLNSLKLKAVEDFKEDLTNKLNIEFNSDTTRKEVYNSNPYAQDLINQNNNIGFSKGPGEEKRTYQSSSKKRRKNHA
jgi:hypothetical protein